MSVANNPDKGPLENQMGGAGQLPKETLGSEDSNITALQPHPKALGQTQTPQSGSSSNTCLSVSPLPVRRAHSPCRRLDIVVDPESSSQPFHLTNASGISSGNSQQHWQNDFSNQQHLKPHQNANSNPFARNLKTAVSHENLRARLVSQDSEEVDPLSRSFPAHGFLNFGRQRNSYSPDFTHGNRLIVPGQDFKLDNNLSRCCSTEQLQVPSPSSPFSWLGLSPRTSKQNSPCHSPFSPQSRSRSPSPGHIGPHKINSSSPKDTSFTKAISNILGGNRSPKSSSPKLIFGSSN